MNKNNYRNGIKFECQGSSNCCVSRGSYGYVYLSITDLKKLSNYFSISSKKFKEKYCERTDGYLHLKVINKNGNCQFLKGTRCSVYKARPAACRSWPFWRENMNAKTWNKEIVNFCPGIGKGKILSFSKIESKINNDFKNEKLIENERKFYINSQKK